MRLKPELLLRWVRRKRKEDNQDPDDHSKPIFRIRIKPICQLMMEDIKIEPAYDSETIGYIIEGPIYDVYDEYEDISTRRRYGMIQTSSISEDDVFMKMKYQYMFHSGAPKKSKPKYGYVRLDTDYIEGIPIKEKPE